MPEVPLLELENLHIARSHADRSEVLVRNLSLRLERGQSLGLVGESGSGKSLTALAILNLLPEPEISIREGQIRFRGQNLRSLSARAMNELRGSRMAVIVQDALAALNPVRKIRVQMEEVFRFHSYTGSRGLRQERISICLKQAGLPATEAILGSYPHELSGGMRQRVLLAMAMLLKPDLLIADEPTTALDVSLQAHWVRQVQTLQREQQMGLLFISHDLALVAELCDRIAVLFRGQLIELASTTVLMEQPRHPYTQAMMKALPRIGQKPQGIMPHVKDDKVQGACPYAAHCPKVMPICQQTIPTLEGTGGHLVACHAVKN